jgi:hypothetical protein
MGVAVALAACSHESPVGQSPAAPGPGCTSHLVSPTIVHVTTAGREVQVSVTTGAGCQWTVSTSVAWIRLEGATSRQGTDVFVLDVTAGATERRGTVTVSWAGGSQSIDVTQGCNVGQAANLSPERQDYLVGAPGCNFFGAPVSINVPWISLVKTSFDDLLKVSVDVNSGPERIGVVTTAIGQLTIVQRAGNCVTAIAPTSQAFDENGGAGSISVTAVPGCAWDATAYNFSVAGPSLGSSSLLTPLTAHGIGSGVLPFTIAANKGLSAYAPFFVVGGSLKFQITQSGCPLTVSPLSFHVPAAAADYFVSVRVTGPVSCNWVDFSNDDSIIFIGNPESRNGPADVRLSVRQNQTGQVRTASANVAPDGRRDAGSLTAILVVPGFQRFQGFQRFAERETHRGRLTQVALRRAQGGQRTVKRGRTGSR